MEHSHGSCSTAWSSTAPQVPSTHLYPRTLSISLPPLHPPPRVSCRGRSRKRAIPFHGVLNWRRFSWARTLIKASPSSSQPPALASTPPDVIPASTVVRDFYDGINRRDLDSVAPLIAVRCVYEDLIFSGPFVGREAILEFFKKFTESISSDLQFAIDDISGEDSSAVGVTWHLEWRGRPFPFSRGCSFYRLEVVDGKRQIVYGRDCVEPTTKLGELALVLIRAVTSLLRQFPRLADRF